MVGATERPAAAMVRVRIWPRSIDGTGLGLDESRPQAVARRRRVGRTARRGRTSPTSSTPGSFIEYGPLVVAAQRRRRGIDDLIDNTPADGLVGGIGTVNGDLLRGPRGRAAS